MNQNDIRDTFFRIETENHLFDLVDKKGNRSWDIIRSSVYFNILFHYFPVATPPNHSFVAKTVKMASVKHHLSKLWHTFTYFISHWNKKYLVILCSRNEAESKHFDKIADSLLSKVNIKDCYLIETYLQNLDRNYKYGKASPSIVDLLRYVYSKGFDYDYILQYFKKDFPDVKWNVELIRDTYGRFYAHYYYYRFLLKVKHVKKCFLVQNRYHDGLYLAAKQLGIPVVEFQHGEITKNHPVYSYPHDESISEKIYKPTTVLTFGEFWMKDCFYPGVNVSAVGNNYYYNAHPKLSSIQENKDILVISDSLSCEELSSLIEKTATKYPDKNIHYYFKLHPNQEYDYNRFLDRFKDYPGIEVVHGNRIVSDYFTRVAFVLAIESTVEFEALNAGVKIMVYKRGTYQYLESIFKEKGVFLIDNEDEFMDIYELHLNDEFNDCVNRFFKPFDPNVLSKYL